MRGDGILAGHAQGGDDLLIGGAGFDFLQGEGNMYDAAVGGNDWLSGGANGDLLLGDGLLIGEISFVGSPGLSARCGDDRLDGGSGSDTLHGDGATVVGLTVCGNGVLIGGTGNDRFFGDADPNPIQGSDLTDVTRGADRFVFAIGSGLDEIVDFQDDLDLIDLTGFAGITGFAQVGAQASQVGADTVIDLGAAAGGAGGQVVLTLVGFAATDLNATDFLFA
jgi:Ca2+-binding RTX toxin-like protein